MNAGGAGGSGVQRQTAIVGYGDIGFAEASLIPLTSVMGRHDGFGIAVVDLLFDAIGGNTIDAPHRMFEPQLVVRASTGRS